MSSRCSRNCGKAGRCTCLRTPAGHRCFWRSANLAAFVPPPYPYRRGYGRLFLEHVLQAPQGCDFDFLTGDPAEARRAALLSRDLRT